MSHTLLRPQIMNIEEPSDEFTSSDLSVPRCGYVALIGRPNVGKSTLLNALIGQKISITAAKPQTTRHQILGIKTLHNTQIIYVDTPGLHQFTKRAINRYMNRAALLAIAEVDVIGFVIQALQWTKEDEWILTKLKASQKPIVLIINKVDRVKPKEKLLPYLYELNEKHKFTVIVPVSAKLGYNLQAIENEIAKLLPENAPYFSADQLTDKSDEFIAAEIIREKLTRLLQQELPYAVNVEIEKFSRKEKLLHISAIIWLERSGQKAIVIGDKGERLKKIGQSARLELEKIFKQKIFLSLWVRIKENWSDDAQLLKRWGYILHR